jgi:hypothetical protein
MLEAFGGLCNSSGKNELLKYITRPDVPHLLTYFQLRAEKRVVAGTDYLNQAASISPASI